MNKFVFIIPADGTTSCSGNCCWKGITSSSCDSANGEYSGCTRTVCNHIAALNVCYNLLLNGHTDWFLSTYYQLSQLKLDENSIGIGSDGLQLCDSSSGYNSSQCTCRGGYCVGSQNNYCYPNYLWSNTGYTYALGSGAYILADYRDYKNLGFSVRCIRKKT